MINLWQIYCDKCIWTNEICQIKNARVNGASNGCPCILYMCPCEVCLWLWKYNLLIWLLSVSLKCLAKILLHFRRTLKKISSGRIATSGNDTSSQPNNFLFKWSQSNLWVMWKSITVNKNWLPFQFLETLNLILRRRDKPLQASLLEESLNNKYSDLSCKHGEWSMNELTLLTIYKFTILSAPKYREYWALFSVILNMLMKFSISTKYNIQQSPWPDLLSSWLMSFVSWRNYSTLSGEYGS